MSFSDLLPDLPQHKRNIRYSGVNCALGPSKSIRYSGDFVTAGFVVAGFVIAGFISTYFTVILPGLTMLFVITGSSLKGVRYSGVPLHNVSFLSAHNEYNHFFIYYTFTLRSFSLLALSRCRTIVAMLSNGFLTT